MRVFIFCSLILLYIPSLPVCIGQPNDSSGLLKVHLDLRTTISEGRRLRMGGASIGWEWGIKRDEVTLGYYWTGARGRKDISQLPNVRVPSLPSHGDIETDLRFVSAGYWMTVRDWHRWKLSIPMEAGIGTAKFTHSANQDLDAAKLVENIRILPLQAALYGEWKATRWVGVGAHVGYRHYLSDQNHTSLAPFSGLYYRFRVLLYIQTFYDWRNHLFRKEPLPSPFY